MHAANWVWWETVRDAYPHLFTAPRVLEVGSCTVNASVRPLFDASVYIGVDWRDGPDVDVVTLAHAMEFDEPFDVVVSASMLEHDPYARDSLQRMVDCLASDGALLLSWGSAENGAHAVETAPDGQFHALPAGHVLMWLADMGVYVERFMYEAQIHPQGGWGECGLVAFRDRAAGIGEQSLSELRADDVVALQEVHA